MCFHRPPKKYLMEALSIFLAVLLVVPFVFHAPPSWPAAHGPTPQQEQRPKTPQEIELEEKQKRDLRKLRYEELKQRANRLADLSNQLNAQIEKAGEHTLPIDAIKRIEEIESLAKKIKSQLKSY